MIWAQIGDSRITAVPPSGSADVYATFTFSGVPLPEGIQVNFLVGTGDLPSTTNENTDAVQQLSEQDVVSAITPIDGVVLSSNVGIVEKHLVKDSSDNFVILAAAKVTMTIAKPITADGITLVAYSTFDRLGKVKRLQAQSARLTVSRGGGVFMSAVEKYDPVGNSWSTVAAMNVGRSGLTCVALGGKIYAMGGNTSDFLDANEAYDPIADKWTMRAPMLSARGFCSSVTDGTYVYLIGGYNFSPGRGSDSFERYDPVGNAWTPLPSLPAPVAYSTAQVIGGDIYVLFGGSRFTGAESGSETVSIVSSGVYKYDISGGTWSIEDVKWGVSVGRPAPTSPVAVAASAGAFVVFVQQASAFAPYGVVTIAEGLNSEVVRYVNFNASSGAIELATPLVNGYSTLAAVRQSSLPEARVGPNSYVNGSSIVVLNGQAPASNSIAKTAVQYNTSTKFFDVLSFSPNLPRFRGGSDVIGTKVYITGGSAAKSDFLDNAEVGDIIATTFVGTPTITKMKFARYSLGVAATGGFVYAAGGGGSGHEPGWLKIDVKADPQTVRADGKSTASIFVTATDASGDKPPDGLVFKVKGVIYVPLTDQEKAAQKASATQTTATQSSTGGVVSKPAPQTVSILPVLFSSLTMTMTGGKAATTLLGRSEDPVTEVENLLKFVKAGESVPNQQALKMQFDGQARNVTQHVGDNRTLYSAAIEVSAQDPTFFGTSSTDATVNQLPSKPLSSSGFSFNPPPAQQGLSASVNFFSDITSIPDVLAVTPSPVNGTTAKSLLARVAQDLPFGSSPHFDALFLGAEDRNGPPPLTPLTNIMISASDNDENSSQSTPQDVVDEANAVDGVGNFPIFVTTFVVTDPVSLSARKARTDVANLELISSETGGNSFSVINASYVGFVIDRIKTSAPASIGSGTIEATRAINGSLSAVRFSVSNLAPSGNSATMTISHSVDGYNYTTLEQSMQPNSLFTLGTPIFAKFIKYSVRLQSKDFNSPVLTSVELNYVKPSVQYLFTYPQDVPGQVSELASVVNHRLPPGGLAMVGIAHGDSLMFDRDYASVTQPASGERGEIMALNRNDGGTFIGDQSTRDALATDDFIVYRSKSGPWVQDAVTSIFVNNVPALPTDFIALPEQGVIAFRKRMSPKDSVTMEVQNPSSFRVAIKTINPSLQGGVLDSFAYMYGSTEGAGLKANRPPVAVNLFITPTPVEPGGPITANYTFVDPDGDKEDATRTEINWFRNGVIVPELAGKRSITNLDIVAKRADGSGLITKDQEWFFSVRPSDGLAFGPLAVSHSITVANLPPTATGLQVKSSNADPLTYSSSDTLTAAFTYTDNDGDAQSGTIYTWFANGIQVKSGTSSTLLPTDVDQNNKKILSAGSAITVQVAPSDGIAFGETVTSQPVTIAGTPPSAKNVSILPTAPTAASNLTLTYQYVDVDNLPDQSTIAWFQNGNRITSLDNSKFVPSSFLTPTQQWQAVVTPSNGTAGKPVNSNTVTVKF